MTSQPPPKRSAIEPSRYEYLSAQDSVIFDRALTYSLTREEACLEVVRLLGQLAAMSRAQHAASPY